MTGNKQRTRLSNLRPQDADVVAGMTNATPSNPAVRTSYKREVEGLRALAVIAVIINHFNKDLMPSGYLGVDIFFVISGYVISASLYNSHSQTISDFILTFYTKRVKRLLPSLVLFTFLASALICLFNPNPDTSLKTGVSALFGLSNIYLLKHSSNYFAESSEFNVFTHTWSLGVEEQFYVFFPLIVWYSGFNQKSHTGAKKLFWLVATSSTISLAAFIYLNNTNQSAAFFLMPSRFWELGIGCIAYLIATKAPVNALLARPSPTLIATLLIANLFSPLYYSTAATIAEVALTALLLLTVRSETFTYKLLTHPVAIHIGVISYSLYLWHWGILSISRWTVGINLWTVPMQVLLMLIAAATSYYFVERPLRSAVWSNSRWITICYGFGGSFVVAAMTIAFLTYGDGRLFLGVTKSDKSNTISKLGSPYIKIEKQTHDLRMKCNMTPNHLIGKDYRPKPLIDSAFLRNCITGLSGAKKILLVGDSFASVSAAHLGMVAGKLGYDFRMIFGYGCPYPLPFAQIKSSAKSQCNEVDEQLLMQEILGGLTAGDLLIIRLYLPKPQYLSYKNGALPPIDAYDDSILKLVRAVTAKGAKVLVVGANPTLSMQHVQSLTPQWFHLFAETDGAYIRPAENPETALYHLIDDHLQDYLQKIPGASYFSLKPYLCNTLNFCKIREGDMLLYSDEQHLTPYGHDLFFEDILSHIKNMLAQN